jgi:hypothetical protein
MKRVLSLVLTLFLVPVCFGEVKIVGSLNPEHYEIAEL